ncbi:FeoB small GTPase domain-containing protein [Lactococcus lactis]
MKIIALLGNPNSGKTSIFNQLTGSNQQVGNWPGVTVEKKSGFYRKDKSICIQDLPGLYSLSPYSLDEQVARDFLTKTPPDALINIVDSTNLERSLYLTLQLMELGIPMVLALNMSDLLAGQGKKSTLKNFLIALEFLLLQPRPLKIKV